MPFGLILGIAVFHSQDGPIIHPITYSINNCTMSDNTLTLNSVTQMIKVVSKKPNRRMRVDGKRVCHTAFQN